MNSCSEKMVVFSAFESLLHVGVGRGGVKMSILVVIVPIRMGLGRGSVAVWHLAC